MTVEPRARRLARFTGDMAVAALALWAAFVVRIRLPVAFTEGLLPADRLNEFLPPALALVLLAQPLALYFFGLYDTPQPRNLSRTLPRLTTAVVFLGLASATFFFLADRTFPRSVLVIFVLLDLVGLLLWRRGIQPPITVERRRVALVGGGPAAVELATTIAAQHLLQIDIVGWVPAPSDDPSGLPWADSAGDGPLGRRLGELEDLPALMETGAIDDVVIAASSSLWKTRLLDRLAAVPGARRGNVMMIPGPFESMIGRMRYRWVEDIPLIEVVRDSEWRLFLPVKRLLDLLFGSLLALVFLPVMLVAAAVVWSTSPGPILYRQQRMGRGAKPFTLVKFRTMHDDAERESGEVLASLNDRRLTAVGATLRRYRLDELPQLWNVLTGSMSLVGPRPERPGFVARYLEEIPGYSERFAVPPGLTGLAQINGEYHSTAQNKLRYDLAYIANWSVWLDLWILVQTVKIVLTSRGV